MALDLNQLAAALKQAFEDGMEAETSEPVAQAIAEAIHAYVSGATVNGVVVGVVDNGANPIGTGTQTQPVNLT